MSNKQKVAKSAVIIMILSLVSKVFGFVREQLLGS